MTLRVVVFQDISYIIGEFRVRVFPRFRVFPTRRDNPRSQSMPTHHEQCLRIMSKMQRWHEKQTSSVSHKLNTQIIKETCAATGAQPFTSRELPGALANLREHAPRR